MAQIQDYTLDTTPENSDFVLGGGDDNITKRFTLSDLKTFFQSGLPDEAANNYPETLTLDNSTAVLTIERNGLSDLTASFGTAALKPESFFATASHSHTISDILSSNDITADYLNVADNGESGQYLASDGDGSFSWVDAPAANTNFYLTGIAKNGNNLNFTVSGAPTETISVTLGSAAYAASSSFAASDHSHTISEITGAGNLATLDKISAVEIKEGAIITSKIKDSQVTAAKLAIAGDGTPGQVLSSDGDGTFSWSDPTGQNYFLSNITKTSNTLNFIVAGSSTQSYTFGAAAFLDTGTTSSTVALGNHTHTATDITGLGAIATLDEITTDEIAAEAVTAAKIAELQVTTGKIASGAITEPKLDISNTAVSGYVLTSDGSTGFAWAENTSSNYYLNAITKSANTLTFEIGGGLASGDWPTYTFGDAAFKSTGTTSGDVAAGDHSHDMSSITNAGDLATLNAVEPTNLSGLADNGTSGQLIQTDGDGTFSYVDAGGVSNDSITFTQLANQFKAVATAATLSSSTTTVTNDFSAAAVFPITLASDATNTTITYSNTTIGQTKILKVTGSGGTGTVTITGTNLGGTLDQTSSTVNYIQVTAIGTSEYIYTISQA